MKKRKKARKKAPRPKVLTAEEAERLSFSLDDGGALSGAEFMALVEHLRAESQVSKLRDLADHARSAAELKAVKKALYRLGASLSTVRPSTVNVGARVLPVLMSEPSTDATRIFTFAEQGAGADVTVVEAYFCMPEGLFRLKSSPSTAGAFEAWTKTMTAQGRGIMPASLRPRKLWEIGEHARRGNVGNEFDAELARRLWAPASPPPHPITTHDLSGASPTSLADLRRRDLLRPFRHGTVEDALRREWRAHGSTMIRSSATASWLDASVSDWAGQWGYDHIAELCRDTALFHAERREPGVAKAYLDIVTESDDMPVRDKISRFLSSFVEGLLT